MSKYKKILQYKQKGKNDSDNVLWLMFVTAAICHFEMSALKDVAI